jgi:hypothetical protein
VARFNPRLGEASQLPKSWHVEEIGGVQGHTAAQDGGFLLRVPDWPSRDTKIQPAHFVYRMVRSEPEITARVVSVSGPGQCVAGLMLRGSLEPDGGLALLGVTPEHQLCLETRPGGGQRLERRELGNTGLPTWLKLAWEAKGGIVFAYRSTNGSLWETMGQARLNCPSEPFPEDSDHWQPKIYAGLALAGGQTNTAATARLEGVALSARGLLGQYYSDEQFFRLRFARLDRKLEFWWGQKPPAPDLAPGCFSVRWTGQLEPRYTEAYRFHFEADDSARLWVNGQELPAAKFSEQPEKYERVKALALTAGRKCDVIFEFMNEQGAAKARLGWSSPSQKLEVIPEDRLSYTYAAGSLDEENEGAITNICHLKGIYLRDGSFIAGEVVSADPTTALIRFGSRKSIPVLTSQIARILLRNVRRPLPFDRAASQTGVFLKNGDFLESELASLEGRALTMSSILFGRRRFSTQKPETAALVLHRFAPGPAPWEVKLVDGSSLRAKGIRLAEGGIVVDDLTLGPVRLTESELGEIRNIATPGIL